MIYKYFLPFGRLPFHVVDGFICYTDFQCDVIPFIFAFGVRPKKSRLMSRSSPSMFSSRSFMVSGLTSKSLIHCEIIFMYGINGLASFFCMFTWLSSLNSTYWRNFPFPIAYPCLLRCKLIGQTYMGLSLGSLLCSLICGSISISVSSILIAIVS